VPAKIATPRRSDLREPGLGVFALVLAFSLAAHLAFFHALTGTRAPTHKSSTSVDMEIVEQKKPKPIPLATPEPPRPLEKPKPNRVKLPPPPKAPPPKAAPPPPMDPPAKPPPPAPINIGLHLSSTTQAGSFAAPVGNTLYGKAAEHAPDPNAAKPYATPAVKFVPSYQLTDAPVPLNGDVIGHEYYPPQAQKDGVEGQVTLQLTVDASGRVTAAKVLQGAGHGFDEAAMRGAREKLRFKPARLDGQAVGTEIAYKITFLLD
jgi:periplasmic protein TonB